MRDRFMANNGCSGEENPPPAVGSFAHVRTDYECSGPPATWVAFVCLPTDIFLNKNINLTFLGWWTYLGPMGWPG